MKKIFLAIATVMLTAGVFASCEKLDLQPKSETSLMEDDVFSTYDGYHGFFLKLYSSMAVAGQGGDGGNDVSWDGGRSVYLRSLYWVQECPTDIVITRTGNGYQIPQTVSLDWTTGSEFPKYLYYRAYIVIAMCNEFLRQSEESVMQSRGVWDKCKDEVGYWRAEARFIRAYQYYLLCDLYGSVGWVDDSTPNGTYPEQKTREEIFNYIESELLDIEDDMMPSSKKVFGRANQASAWFLLSKLYINCAVYTGKADRYDDALKYAEKVVKDANYSLAPNYIENFLKDNDTCNEIIWAIPTDDEHMQGEGVTNYLMKTYTSTAIFELVDYGLSANYSCNASFHTAFTNKFAESDQEFDGTDTWGDKKMDHRALLVVGGNTGIVKETWYLNDAGQTVFSKDYHYGATMSKWRNVTKDRAKVQPTKYSNVAFPMFRKADAYLIAAEAILRGAKGAKSDALKYVNEVRDRAYCDGNYYDAVKNHASGKLTESELTLDFLLDERARELYMENWRRSDLIRFGKYTKGYNWDWKGINKNTKLDGGIEPVGHDIDDRYKLYPIPQEDVLYNPLIHQNPDYE